MHARTRQPTIGCFVTCASCVKVITQMTEGKQRRINVENYVGCFFACLWGISHIVILGYANGRALNK